MILFYFILFYLFYSVSFYFRQLYQRDPYEILRFLFHEGVESYEMIRQFIDNMRLDAAKVAVVVASFTFDGLIAIHREAQAIGLVLLYFYFILFYFIYWLLISLFYIFYFDLNFIFFI